MVINILYVNNDFKCKHIKFSNQRLENTWMDQKQDSEMCYLQRVIKFKTNIG